MIKPIAKFAVIGMLLAIAPALSAKAQMANGYAMATGATTTQPYGHYEFCRTHWAECRYTGNSDPVVLTDAVWSELNAVNRHVNATIAALTDRQIYGQEEFWAYPTNVGDCEDFVLLKRRLLADAGIALGNLLVTMVFLPDGQGHAVLTVRTDRGDLVLDNLSNEVRLWTETGYRFVKRQSTRDAGVWVTISGGAVAIAQPPAMAPGPAPITGEGPLGDIARPAG